MQKHIRCIHLWNLRSSITIIFLHKTETKFIKKKTMINLEYYKWVEELM